MPGEGSLFDVPPAAIGRFRVLHQVGAGTSGPVFRAAHPETDVPLAIKLVTLPLPPERAAAIVTDFEALLGLMPASPGGCELVDAGLHGANPYLVMVFAPGDSLDVALRQFGPAVLADLTPRLKAIARALDAAAGCNVLHGALHPRDVLVSDASTLVTGLGVWPILARHGERFPIRRPYRAPELADNAASTAGDCFSLAALSYEWMTGRRAPTAFVAGDMAPIEGANRDALGHVFARALHPDPAVRHTTCAAFVDDLAALDGSQPTDLQAPGETMKAEGRPKRRGSRASVARSRLPLDVFPAEGDHDGPAPTAGALTTNATRDDVPPVPDARDDDAPPVPDARDDDGPHAPAASTPLRAVTQAQAEVSFRDFGSLQGSTAEPAPSGTLRLLAGVVIGVVIGLGAGFLWWGRDADRTVRGAANTIAAGAPEGQPSAAPTGLPAAATQETPAAAGSAPAAAPAAATERTPAAAAPPSSATGGATTAPLSPQASPPDAVPAGSLLVRSTPAGATVFVDGQRRGVTPLTLQRVELGTRRVRLQRDGFTAEERQVTLTGSRPSRSLEVRLTRAAPTPRTATPAPAKPAATTGTLVIESRPSGATIVLNGRQVGTTPMTIDDLEPGSYTVRLQLAAYRPVTTTVRVVAGARARAAASLVSAQEPQ